MGGLGRRGDVRHTGAQSEYRSDRRRLIHDPLDRVRYGATGKTVEQLANRDRTGGIRSGRQCEGAANAGRPGRAAVDARLPRGSREEPVDRDGGVVRDAVGAAATGIRCQRQRGHRQRHRRSRFRRILTVADAVDGPHAEYIRGSIAEPRHRGRRGKADRDRGPRDAGKRPVFDFVPHKRRVVGEGGIPGEGHRRIASRGDHVRRHAGHVGQRDRERRRAIDLVRQELVVGKVGEQTRHARHTRLRRRCQHVLAHREDGRRLEHHAVVVLEIPEQIVGALDEHDAIAGEGKRGLAHGRRVDAHADVVELEFELRHAACRGQLEPNRVGIERILVVGAVVERVEQRERGLRGIDPVNRTAVFKGVAAEARQACLCGIVAAELAETVAVGGNDWRLWDADCRGDGDVPRPVGQRVERAVDRLRAGVEVEVAGGGVHERISSERDLLALRAARDLGGGVPVGRRADHGVGRTAGIDRHTLPKVGEQVVEQRRTCIFGDGHARALRARVDEAERDRTGGGGRG